MNYFRQIFLVLLALGEVSSAGVAVSDRIYEYKDGKTVLEGYVAIPKDGKAKHSVVLVVPEWKGVGEYSKRRARMLAELGYLGFVVDVYGKGVRPSSNEEAGKLAGKYKGDRPLLQKRMQAALTAATQMPQADAKHVAVIGYCFGGTAALELARTGAPLSAVVSFHGGLSNPTPENAAKIAAPVLVLHGADDPFVKPDEVKAFKDEMKLSSTMLRFIAYPDAVHSFTNPDAGNDKKAGAAYNAEADKKSWQEMQSFLKASL